MSVDMNSTGVDYRDEVTHALTPFKFYIMYYGSLASLVVVKVRTECLPHHKTRSGYIQQYIYQCIIYFQRHNGLTRLRRSSELSPGI